MRHTLLIEIDDDALRASRMTPDTYLRRAMGSLQEYGIRVITPQDLAREELRSALKQSPDDRRETFYFSFGTANYFPYKHGWVEVRANSREEACKLFSSHFPNRNGMLNCSFVYNEREWARTEMSQGLPGQVCHQVIDAWGPYRDAPAKGLGDLLHEAKERLGSRDATKEHNKQKQPPELGR